MKTLKGTVRKRDVEGGVWVLEAGRETFQLKDGPPDLYQEGIRVSLQGEVRKDVFGIGMSGPVFEVKKVL
jgi:hypothetical protein